MNRKVKPDLGFMGFDCQLAITKALIEDKDFFLELEPSLNQNAFGGDNSAKLRELVGLLKDFYKDKGYIPSYTDLEYILRDKAKTDIELEEDIAFIQELKGDKHLVGMETAKEQAKRFFKQQETLIILQKGIEKLGKDGYVENETLPKIVEGLQNIGKNTGKYNVYSPMDLFDRAFARDMDIRVPTGIDEIDEAMNGGLPKKALGLIIAGTGAGKSTFSSIICGNAAILGYKVLQIFFEESEEEIAAKHYAHFSGEYTNRINTQGDKVRVWNTIKEDADIANGLKNNIKLTRMTNSETQVADIKNLINHLKTTAGFNPDMVCIDYFSCLQHSSDKRNEYTNEWKAEERAMKKLEQMAQDLDIAVWVTQQTNRNGVKLETANDRLANVQGSFRITQPCSFIFYLDRTPYDKMSNDINIYMDKCRGCQATEWIGVFMNNGNLQIDMSHIINTSNDTDTVFNEEPDFNPSSYR